MNKKIVVIGINHAGTSAVKTLLMQNPKLKVVGFDRSDKISFLGCGIALAVGGVVKNTNSLFYSNPQELRNMGAEIKINHDVIKIDHQKKFIKVKDLKTGREFEESYDVLVYGAGSWPFIIPFHKPEYKGIKLCKNYEQAMELIKDANNHNVKNIAILGAGYIGCELVEAFADKKLNKKVYLVDMEDRILPRYFDHAFTDPVENKMREEGVELFMSSKVIDSIIENNVVKGLKVLNLKNNEEKTIYTDLVISCVGFAPNTKMLMDAFPNVGLARNKSVWVNSHAQALDKDKKVILDLYVIGDSAAQYYIPSKTYENVALATNAVKLGVAAGASICGLNAVKVDSITGTNAISVFGYSYTSTGVSVEGAKRMGLQVKSALHEGNDRCEFMNKYEKVKIQVVYDEKTLRLVGAQIGSSDKTPHTEAIYMLSLAIQKEMTLLDLLTIDVYFLPHLNKPFNFILCSLCDALNLKYGDHVYVAPEDKK